MKAHFIAILLLFITINTFSQNSTKVLGVWQAKLNGKFMTGADAGITTGPFSSKFFFYVFTKDKMYLAICSNKTSVTSANMKNLIAKEEAMDGTYSVYNSMDLMSEELRLEYEAWNPFEDKTFFITALVQGSPMSFYYEVTSNKFMGLSKETNLQLIKVGEYK